MQQSIDGSCQCLQLLHTLILNLVSSSLSFISTSSCRSCFNHLSCNHLALFLSPSLAHTSSHAHPPPPPRSHSRFHFHAHGLCLHFKQRSATSKVSLERPSVPLILSSSAFISPCLVSSYLLHWENAPTRYSNPSVESQADRRTDEQRKEKKRKEEQDKAR